MPGLTRDTLINMDKLLTVPLASFPLVGTKKQITKYLIRLKAMHCTWEEDGKYYLIDPKKNYLPNTLKCCTIRYHIEREDDDKNSDSFVYYLTNLNYISPQAFQEHELKPLFWDSLLRCCGIEVD
ncbi:MAG: hypothetical protein EAZ10_01805 [Oscillatoriales cyanobacterium]|uniref:hypothetical protein n=1 Tax=Microcoleus sp. PH2017_37_MFU_D_B TaxID=2798847 RepID=UPI001E19DE36|nr:hypothetical protein [Microcoleus sp. PH2017_37_MFU_D_B]MCC3637421.1 hypothetical protein [Microcoleus sp. PH2017_37_MFU_D_B]TAH31087.1 MAG: hypothetical protein EAZ10_01805 [Oscillatoriales cyanobacterium]